MKNGGRSRPISKKVIYRPNAESSSTAHRRSATFRTSQRTTKTRPTASNKQSTTLAPFLPRVPLRGHRRPDLTTRPVRFWTLSRAHS